MDVEGLVSPDFAGMRYINKKTPEVNSGVDVKAGFKWGKNTNCLRFQTQ